MWEPPDREGPGWGPCLLVPGSITSGLVPAELRPAGCHCDWRGSGRSAEGPRHPAHPACQPQGLFPNSQHDCQEGP
jgi:hypothetical protein